MTDWRSSDDPGRSESERRQDANAWKLIGGLVERGGWHAVDRAVAKAVPEARARGLLDDCPWKVYLFPKPDRTGDRMFVNIEPSGRWEFGSEGAAGVTSFASSDLPGVYTTENAWSLALRVALRNALGDD